MLRPYQSEQIVIKMANLLKEPSIKLIPSDPMTNTILIIYCVSSSGASVPYKSSWRRVHPKKNKVEEIRHHNGSSYRCSPLDIDYIIQATVYYQHQNTQVSRIIQSNVVKLCRQLKEKKIYLRDQFYCRISFDEGSLQTNVSIHQSSFHFTPIAVQSSHLSLLLPISDLNFEADINQLSFRMIFKKRSDDFANFIFQVLGKKIILKNNELMLHFSSDMNRDLILLGISEAIQRIDRFQSQGMHLPISTHTFHDKKGTNTTRYMQRSGRSKNKAITTVSPAHSFKQKYSNNGKIELKKSNHKQEDNKNQNFASPLQPKQEKERQYLNVFEDQDLQFLNAPILPKPTAPNSDSFKLKNHVVDNKGDQPSINLRSSFEELQKSFHSHINDQILQKAFGDGSSSKKFQDEIESLKRQNDVLKKQNQSIAILTKQNNSLKRKYLEMKEEINRLQMQRKVILTDKLRCEVNWHKQIQQKQQLKKELESIRDKNKTINNLPLPERSKSHSFNESQKIENKYFDRQQPEKSPNRNFNK